MLDLKIGDEVYIHGFVDEIRRDTVIIKNKGGYFGTVADEIMPTAQPEKEIIYCGECKHMMLNGRCRQFADESIRPSASDFCSAGERRTDG